MSLESLNNAQLQNNKNIGTSFGQNQTLKGMNSASIFSSAATSNRSSSASVFGSNFSNMQQTNGFSTSSIDQLQNQNTQKDEASGGIMDKIKSFFIKPNTQAAALENEEPKQDLVTKAQDVSTRAAAAISMLQSMITENEQNENEQNESDKASTANKSNSTEQKDEKEKDVDYSKATAQQLDEAISKGEPKNKDIALQMASNPNLTKEQAKELKSRFASKEEIVNAIDNQGDKFS